MKKTIDISTIQNCKAGKAFAQKQLFDAYSKHVYATAMRYVADTNNAKDIVQDTFIRVFKYINSFDGEVVAFKSWISRICINESLKTIKKNQRFYSIEPGQEMGTYTHKKELELEAEYIYNEILKLPSRYRTVFNLYTIEGYSHREIAETMGIKEASSRSCLTRAKQMLKERILVYQKQQKWI